MSWQDFEAFAVEVLRRYYRQSGLELVQTPLQGDRGRDGDAVLILGSSHAHPLQVLVRVWVEVKQRRGVSVGLTDLGGNVLLAFLEAVTKLVLVTNSGFSPQLRMALSSFASRLNLQYSLIDGSSLATMAAEVGCWSYGSPALEHQRHVTSPESPEPMVTLRWTLATDCALATFGPTTSDVRISSGEPMFLVAEVEAGHLPLPVSVEIRVARLPRQVADATPPANANGLLSRSEHLRFSWPFWPQGSGRIDAGDFDIRLGSPVESGIHVLRTHAATGCKVVQGILGNHVPPSRRRQLEELKGQVRRWREEGGLQSIFLLSAAGSGKSHLLRLLRREWLEQGIDELFLEGGIHATDRDVFSRVCDLVMPRELIPAEPASVPVFESLLEAHGFSSSLAETLSAWIVGGVHRQESGPSEVALGRALGHLVAVRSANRPIVISFDDLHKTRPSVLAVLSEAVKELRTLRGSNVLLVVASREASLSAESSTRAVWQRLLDELLVTLSPRVLKLQALTEAEATALLRTVVPRLHESTCQRILEITGRTPFALREALACMRDTGSLLWDEALGEYLPLDRAPLQRIRSLTSLAEVTSLRLSTVRERLPPEVLDFLDAGACLGGTFEFAHAHGVVKARQTVQLEAGLRDLERHEILRASRLGAGWIEFDHDLVRRGTLSLLSRVRHRQIASTLLDHKPRRGSTKTRALLAYQAARGDDCLQLSLAEADAARSDRRFADEAEQLSLALSVLEPPIVASLGLEQEVALLDDAVALSAPIERATPVTREVRIRVLGILRRLAEAGSRISSGSGEVVERAANEALLLAQQLGDEVAAAHTYTLLGTVLFERDRIRESAEQHEQAEGMLASFPADEAARDRAMNLIRLAIARRELGALAESRKHLRQARRLCSDDLDLTVFAITNLGATYFHTDWRKTRRYWEEALDIARRHGLVDREVHLTLDLNRLEILEGHLGVASRHLKRIESLLSELRLDFPRLRLLNQQGVLSAVEGDYDLSGRFLRDAHEYALRHQAIRRIWKIRANLACVYEAQDAAAAAYAEDVLVAADATRLLESETIDRPTPQRALLPLANIIQRRDLHGGYTPLIDGMGGVLRLRATALAEGLAYGWGRARGVPFSLARHSVRLAGRNRFVLP